MKENRDKLAEAGRESGRRSDRRSATRALTEGGVDKMNAAVESLTKASHHIAETMYKAQQAPGAAAGAAGATAAASSRSGAAAKTASGQGDVVDAEFVDVDDSKKPN